MKRLLASVFAILLLAGGVACANPPPSPIQSTVPEVSLNPKTDDGFLDDLFGPREPEAKFNIVCESKDGNDKCVPKYRFSAEVDKSAVNKAIKWIAAANEAGATSLLLEINSPGGSISDGFELARAIEDSEAPVSCVVDGEAASMGFYILQSCEHRYMTKRSKLMAHEPALGGNMYGQPNQWQAIADWLKAEREATAIHCQHRLKISMKEYRAKTDGSQMWWMNWEEAQKVGAIDELVATVKAIHKDMLKGKK